LTGGIRSGARVIFVDGVVEFDAVDRVRDEIVEGL